MKCCKDEDLLPLPKGVPERYNRIRAVFLHGYHMPANDINVAEEVEREQDRSLEETSLKYVVADRITLIRKRGLELSRSLQEERGSVTVVEGRNVVDFIEEDTSVPLRIRTIDKEKVSKLRPLPINVLPSKHHTQPSAEWMKACEAKLWPKRSSTLQTAKVRIPVGRCDKVAAEPSAFVVRCAGVLNECLDGKENPSLGENKETLIVASENKQRAGFKDLAKSNLARRCLSVINPLQDNSRVDEENVGRQIYKPVKSKPTQDIRELSRKSAFSKHCVHVLAPESPRDSKKSKSKEPLREPLRSVPRRNIPIPAFSVDTIRRCSRALIPLSDDSW